MNNDPLDRLDKIEERLRKVFEELWPENPRYTLPALYAGGGFKAPMHSRRPTTDVIDEEEKIKIIAELPGVNKGDIDVQIRDHYLTISTNTKSEKKVEEESYIKHERRTQQFFRRIKLPSTIDPEKAKASFKNGILELDLPKVEDEETHRLQVN
jgi:HSP20 family protein